MTSVQRLENEFQEIFKEWGGLDTNWIKRFDQAKQMEKEQIIKTFVDATTATLEHCGIKSNLQDIIDFKQIAEIYYKEEIKQDER